MIKPENTQEPHDLENMMEREYQQEMRFRLLALLANVLTQHLCYIDWEECELAPIQSILDVGDMIFYQFSVNMDPMLMESLVQSELQKQFLNSGILKNIIQNMLDRNAECQEFGARCLNPNYFQPYRSPDAGEIWNVVKIDTIVIGKDRIYYKMYVIDNEASYDYWKRTRFVSCL